MESGRLTGVKPEDLVEFYLGSRASGTLKTYEVAFRKVWSYAGRIGISVFRWGDGEVTGLLVWLDKEGVAENMVKQALAAVNVLFECMGRESPTKSDLVSKVKKTCMKRSNERKQQKAVSREREGTTLRDVRKMVEALYREPAESVEPARRRFLVMQLFLFLGMKRFSDIAKLRVKDLIFLKDGSVRVFMRKTKTDQLGQGSCFFLTGRKYGKVSVPGILRWYLKSLGLEGEDVLFPRFRNKGNKGVVAIKDTPVSYGTARGQLVKEVKLLGLGKLTLHSARIGAATRGAEAGLSRESIKACGGWRSDAVDGYIRLKEPGVVFSNRMLEEL